MSEINQISKALVKFQSQLGGAKKDANNPFFKSKYADLESVMTAIREPLASNDLAVLQPIREVGEHTLLVTMLIHGESGQSIESTMKIPFLADPQKYGSIITYYRRYALSSLLGVHAEDDDGNSVSAPSQAPAPRPHPQQLAAPKSNVFETTAAITYPITFGKFKGMQLGQVPIADLEKYCNYLSGLPAEKRTPDVGPFLDLAKKYLGAKH